MTNEELLCRLESILKQRGMTLYELQKLTNEDVIKESTFYSMFGKRSAVKIEYICEFCRVLDISVSQLIDEKNSKKYLTPVQIELLDEFEGLDDAMIRRIIPMVKGIIFSEKNKQ